MLKKPLLFSVFVVLTVFMGACEGKQEEGDVLPIYVQERDSESISISSDNGLSWSNDNNPMFFMTTDQKEFDTEIKKITVIITNNGDGTLTIGSGFGLLVWSDNSWISSPADGLFHTDEGYTVQAHDSLKMECDLQNNPLVAGKYRITKTIIRDADSSIWTMCAEFLVD